jgi:oligopeptide/dipeptide ABC transporter ATP-binding protein
MTNGTTQTPLLELQNVHKEFGRPGGWLRGADTRLIAVDDVSLAVFRGESFGLVGETGCGKTTLGRLALRFDTPTSGRVLFDNADIRTLRGERVKRFRRRAQMVFQNPFSSLNPRRSVRQTLSAGYDIHRIAKGEDRKQRIEELLHRVGLSPDTMDRYPHQLSGGQRQRVVVARALSVGPELVVADEPVSALDVSVQAQVLNLLKSLQEELDLTYLFITHDLRVVNFFCSRIGVMYLGRLVEVGRRDAVVSRPRHPYTRSLTAAAPSGDPRTRRATPMLQGDAAEVRQSREGCVFSSRCWLKQALGNPERCEQERPVLREVTPDEWVACHFAEETVNVAAGMAGSSELGVVAAEAPTDDGAATIRP